MYGGTYSQVRYSPLDQINPGNVEKLKPAWIFHTKVDSDAGHQTTPVVVGRAMYVTTPMARGVQQVIKLDAETGLEIWRTPIPLEAPTLCCGANNKGVAVGGDKVFLTTVDARLVALNAHDGRVEWTAGLGEPEAGYSNTMAPLTYGNKVFAGSSGGDFGIRGFLKAYDTQTGVLLWTWHSIPSPGQGGWEGDWLEEAPGTGLVYTVAVHLPVRLSLRPNTKWQSRKPFHGGVPEHAPGGREEGHGRVVALDPSTGKVEWSYRTRQPIQSGLLTTASMLVFAGQAEGSFDAWHAATGRHLWSWKTPAGINAAPAAYRIGGRQHIVVAAGGSFGIRLLGFEAPLGDAIVAFALPSVGD